jgi:hypothetical protein
VTNTLLYPPNRRKIGILFTPITHASVARNQIGILANLNQDLFDVTVFCTHRRPDCVYFQKLVASGHRIVVFEDYPYMHYVPNDFQRHNNILPTLNTWAHVIHQADLDVLVYTEVGKHEHTYWLAQYRLAPIQITTWGHAETSGMDTIEYFVSSEWFDDHPEAPSHYTEQLLRLPSLNTYQYNHYYSYLETLTNPDVVFPDVIQDPNDPTPVVSYPFPLHKMSTHDTDVLRDLLEATQDDDHPCIVALVNPTQNASHTLALKQALEPYLSRVLMFPHRLQPGTFYAWLKRSTIVMDAYPHGSCSTTMDALHYHKVVITHPSNYLRGRFTLGLYRKMGMVVSSDREDDGCVGGDAVGDAVVDSREGMVRTMLRYVRDHEHRRMMEHHLRERVERVFQDRGSVRDWEDMLCELCV